MLGKIAVLKYGDPGCPLVTIIIENITILNILVDLGAAINVMTYEIMIKIRCIEAWPISTILQLVDKSTIVTYGIIEDVLVMVDSWEYLVDFMIVKIKSNISGYPIILGRPWLATTDAYIKCRTRNMSIYNGESTKNIIIYAST